MQTELTPSRLSLARRRRGLSKTDLAKAVGISSRIVYDYELGTRAPSGETMSKIAHALGFPVAFFGGPDLDEPPDEGASFRSLSTLTARRRDAALAAGALAIALSDWIDREFVLPAPAIPKYESAVVDPDTAAKSVREEWGLGERPVPDMIRLLESKGVRVFSLAEDSRDVDAFSFWRGNIPYVFLSTGKSAEHQRMDLGHELGHLVLHWKGGVSGRRSELEAQLFGSSFLMPRGSVIASVPPGATLAQIVRAKRIWGVSVASLAFRLHTIGLLTDWQYRQTFIDISRRGYRTREPEPIQAETSKVLERVFALAREGGETMGSISHRLNITLDELGLLVFGLTLAPVPTPLNQASA